MTAFEDFVNLELPRRSAHLTKTITDWDADPNDGGAPAVVKNAPLGAWFREETAGVWWRKTEGVWEAAGGGSGPQIATGDITVTVSTAGNDTPIPQRPAKLYGGDYSAYPYATIQAAINALPAVMAPYTATITVGAGNFAGAHITQKWGTFILQGTLGLASLATGPNTGTATSGGSRYLTLTGAGWTVNDLQGRLLKIVSGTGAGQTLVVAKNTTDTVYLAQKWTTAPNSTSVFEIQDQQSVINSGAVSAFGLTFLLLASYIKGQVTIQNFYGNIGYGAYFSFAALYCDIARINYTKSYQTYYGFYAQHVVYFSAVQNSALSPYYYGCNLLDVSEQANVQGLAIISSGSDAVWGQNARYVYTKGWYHRGCGGQGLELTEGSFFLVDAYFDGSAYGMRLINAAVQMQNCIFDNMTDRVFHLVHSLAKLVGGNSGTGNAKVWHVRAGSYVAGDEVGSIAGTTEIDLDGTVTTYAASLPASGDVVAGPAGSVMTRQNILSV